MVGSDCRDLSTALILAGRIVPKAGKAPAKAKRRNSMMETTSDYHQFFWHVSFGYARTYDDIRFSVFQTLLDRMVNGEFHRLEEDSGIVKL
jgi:hypothetical protein